MSGEGGSDGAQVRLAGRFSRRDFVVGATAMVALAACGGGKDDSDGAAPAGDASFPRRVDTARGPVEIRRRPQRVVTLAAEADAAVVLGTTPVAMAASFNDPSGVDPWLAERIDRDEVELLDLADGVPFERVAAARPDLILAGTHYGIDQDHPQLARIAPVLTHVRGLLADTWQDQTRLIGRALGAEAAAERAVGDVEARIARTRRSHPAWAGRTFVSAFVFEPGSVRVNSPDTFGPQLLESLGLRRSPAVADLPGPDVSLEQLAVLDADLLVMSYASADHRKDLEASPLFAGVPVVRDGRHVTIDIVLATALTVPSVLRVAYVLDQLVPQIEARLH